jgi:hypothetical protein
MIDDFKQWELGDKGRSDFNIVTLNRNHVIMAQRISHDDVNGVRVTMRELPPFVLRTSFVEFDDWLRGIEDDDGQA